MALIKCPECGTEVSSDALKCPKCAKQLRKPQRTVFGKIVKWVLVGFNCLMIAWIIFGTMGSWELGIWIIGDMVLGLLTLLTRPKS